MKLATVSNEGRPTVVLGVGDDIVFLHSAASALGKTALVGAPDTVGSLIADGPNRWAELEAFAGALSDASEAKWRRPAAEAHFLPPLLPPRNAWAVAGNSLAHAKAGYAQLGTDYTPPDHIPFFTKAVTSLVGHGSDVFFDKRATVACDYECELTIVVGRGGRDIAPDDALGHVFGYTIGNDITARDLQIGHGQFFRGKSLDFFGPVGPFIVSAEAIPDPGPLRMRQWVNGELRQDGVFGDMTWQVAEIVSQLSAGMTLEPGDLIFTGTCPEVGFEKMPQIWLQDGDELIAEIEPIGQLRSTIRMAPKGTSAAL